MENTTPFPTWQAVLGAPHSDFFHGRTADTIFDREMSASLSSESLFTQSNARVLLGHAANGTLRMISLPTQLYPAPAGEHELGLGPGMYHHFDVAMYLGDLSYRIMLDGAEAAIDLAADERDNQTVYADHFLPLTRTQTDALDIATLSCAPVAPDATRAPLRPAPLPGPAGALYLLYLRNIGQTPLSGKVVLHAGDMLIGHYEDRAPAMRPLKCPDVDLRQNTLLLNRPDGVAGIHLHDGVWTGTGTSFQAERSFTLQPGEEIVCETYVVLGKIYHDVMPEIYALHLHSALEWINLTAGFWRSRLGSLAVDASDAPEEARLTREIYLRSLFDNFNCLQTDRDGNVLAHWQGAPSHGYGTVWGIDVEPTATSIVAVCPELTLRTMLFFMTRSRVPRGRKDHSIPILVAPVIIARQWLQTTGDRAYVEQHPLVVDTLMSIMDELFTMKAPNETLFPSRFSSDGPVGRRYDYGTNVKVWYAFESLAYILQQAGRGDEAQRYTETAAGIRSAIDQTMVISGPFGPQVSGGTNLGEASAGFYLPEGVPYYDGEDTSSMLAPIYGICEYTHEPWVNYHRFARSLWCTTYDPEFDTLLWNPREPAVPDGTALLSRAGGSVTRAEMREALETLRAVGVDDVTGSIFWWPHGVEYKRSLTRCSQGQGAWAWQYVQQWLGITVDANARRLTIAPRGLLTRVDWDGFAPADHTFDIHWLENSSGAHVRVRNGNADAWEVRVGFRSPGTAATGELTWKTQTLAGGAIATLASQAPAALEHDMHRTAVAQKEAGALGRGTGIVFKRFGPAVLWGHWDGNQQWNLQAMPLALRFVILNGTEHDWSNVVVELTCPAAWTAQGRQQRHWERPDQLQSGTVQLKLGEIPKLSRIVAPFWVRGPHEYEMRFPTIDPSMPVFHEPSQPGAGVTLPARNIAAPEDVMFTAELRATAADGQQVRHHLSVPVRSIPANS